MLRKKRKELVKDVHRIALLGVLFMSILDSGATVQNRENSSLVVEIKDKIVIQSCLNLRVEFIIKEWSFLLKGR